MQDLTGSLSPTIRKHHGNAGLSEAWSSTLREGKHKHTRLLTYLVTLGGSCPYLGLCPRVWIRVQVGDRKVPQTLPLQTAYCGIPRILFFASDACRKWGGP